MRRHRFGYRRESYFLPDGFKEALTAAFKDMRKAGLVSKQNFLCCSSCAGYSIASTFGEKCKKDPSYKDKVKGCVYYHRQSAQNLNNPSSEGFYLQFGKIEASEGFESGLDTVEVGKIITKILSKHRIEWKWDGDPDNCIEVIKKFSNFEPVKAEEPFLEGLA